MRLLFKKNWQYSDFPDEPLPVDGTILHAIERLHPTIAQASGFLSAWVNSESSEAIFCRNNYYYQRTFASDLIAISKLDYEQGIFSYDGLTNHVKSLYAKFRQNIIYDLELKRKVYLFINWLTMFRIGKYKHILKHINEDLSVMQKSKDKI